MQKPLSIEAGNIAAALDRGRKLSLREKAAQIVLFFAIYILLFSNLEGSASCAACIIRNDMRMRPDRCRREAWGLEIIFL
jgi:hypothetical protein